ncbi:MAG TPA: ABC transporter substrate-binding protein [Sphingomicrobium sp.]
MLRTLLRFVVTALIAALALAPVACRQQPEGSVKVVVIGREPKMVDPAAGPLTQSDAVLLENVAQGLVQFDSGGNIVGGLAERWNVSDDGLSYIFRIAATQWSDGRKVTAQQVARILKRNLGVRSRNPLKDPLGAVSDIVAMTDRVIEVRLSAPRPNLLALFAQPELGIVRGGTGTGPFHLDPERGSKGELRLTREVTAPDEEATAKEEVLLSGATARKAVGDFASGDTDLVLGGTFADLAYAQGVKLPRGSLRFDPASGLFGLVPTRATGPLACPDVRRMLSEAFDRDTLVAAFRVPGLAARGTVLEPGLDGILPPVVPAWFATPVDQRRPALQDQASKRFGRAQAPTIRIAIPQGPGADLVLRELQRDWGALGFTVERAASTAAADFQLIDEVAPSSSPAWFVRRFRCGVVIVCDPEIDTMLDSARRSLVAAQRYALIGQAAGLVDDQQLFIPIAAPVRWSLVSGRIRGFAGNRFARHTLTGLQERPGGD